MHFSDLERAPATDPPITTFGWLADFSFSKRYFQDLSMLDRPVIKVSVFTEDLAIVPR